MKDNNWVAIIVIGALVLISLYQFYLWLVKFFANA